VSRATDQLIALGYAAGWSAAKAVPAGAAYRLADLAAGAAMARRGPAVVQLAKNLRRVLGGDATPERLSAETAAGLRSYARYWLETFRLPAMDLDEVFATSLAQSKGMHYIRDAVDSGRGLVLALPHSGNWDVAGLMLSRLHGSLTSVAERLEPESLYRRFVAYRESLGMEILPLTGGKVPVSALLKERLRAGRIVCLLGDRDLTASGVPVTFFGESTRMPAGPAMLAALTGADLCAAHLTFTQVGGRRGWGTTVSPPTPLPGTRLAERVRNGTQALAAQFELNISNHPADWHMLQPLWLADLPAGHVARAGSGRSAAGPDQVPA
jgi:phosphatidylinositol dimannoside acyltransferase